MSISRVRFSFVFAVLGLVAVGTSAGHAGVVQAFTPNGVNSFFNPTISSFTLDSQFTVGASDITVEALGAYKPAAFSPDNVQVGLFNHTTHALIVSVTITNSDTVVGGYAYAAITPLLLSALTEYDLVGLDFRGNNYNTGNNTTVDSAITSNGLTYELNQTSLAVPTGPHTSLFNGIFANMQYEVGDHTQSAVSTPEPSSVVAALSGLVVAGVAVLRRRKAARA